MVIPEYYKAFRGTSPQEDFKDIIFDAMRYMYVQLMAAYDGENTDPVDLSNLPGREFGFEPVEIIGVSAPQRKVGRKRGAAPEPTATVSYKRMLGHSRWQAVYPISEKSATDIAEFMNMEALDINSHVYEKIPNIEDMTYGTLRYGLKSGSSHRLLPLLCNKMLGTIYYMRWDSYSYAIEDHRKTAVIRVTGIPYVRSGSSIIAVNWITGEVHAIYDAVYRYCTGKHEDYFCSWELLDNPELKDDEKMRPARLKDVELLDEVKIKKLDSKNMEKELCTYGNLLSPVETFAFIEDVYALPRHALEKTAIDQEVRFFENPIHDEEFIMPGLFNTLIYTKNLFQCILQTWNMSRWLLPLILTSIKPGVPTKEEYKTVAQWFGLAKPDFKALIRYPNEARFVFFLCMNQYAPTSMKVFEKTYSKVIELSMECDENKTKSLGTYRGIIIDNTQKPIAIKGKRGRTLLVTYKLPSTMAFYMGHRLHKCGWSINHYFKWLIDECYIAAHMDRPDITRDTHICGLIEQYAVDYNRMAKEISPKVPFTLPHNVCVSHDNMVTNYNKIKAEHISSVSADVDVDMVYHLASCYRGADADALAPIDDGGGKCTEKFIVLEPKKPEDIYDEGIVLNHCVGSYCKDIIRARGSMRIYFMRTRRFPNHNLVTVQVNRLASTGDYYISEAAGKGNRKLTEQEDAYLKRWIVAYNQRIKYIMHEKEELEKLPDKLAPMYSRDIRRWIKSAGGKLPSAVPGMKPENVTNAVTSCVKDKESIFAKENYETPGDRAYAIQTQSAYIFGKDGLVDIDLARKVIRSLGKAV